MRQISALSICKSQKFLLTLRNISRRAAKQCGGTATAGVATVAQAAVSKTAGGIQGGDGDSESAGAGDIGHESAV